MLRFIALFFIIVVSLPVYAQQKYIAVYPENVPPYYVKGEDGTTNGFGIELLKDLQRRLGLDIEYVPMPDRQSTMAAIKNGKAQIVPNTISTIKR